MGLQSLCRYLGLTRIDEKSVADQVLKVIKDQAKDRDKKMKGGAQKVDANGRQRYTPEVRVDVCEEHVETLPGGEEAKCWLHTRNAGLKILNLDRNFISDAEVVSNHVSCMCSRVTV